MRTVIAVLVTALAAIGAEALEPPRGGELRALQRAGTLAERLVFARGLGNHHQELSAPGIRVSGASGLPTTGSVQVLALLVDFPDHPHIVPASIIDSMLFGAGNPVDFPRESLREFYRRSSYGLLDIQGTTLGWYTTANQRDFYEGRAALLIEEILAHYDAMGHDFTVYDNDGDGTIDVFNVFWTGPIGEWATFWWGWASSFSDPANPNYAIDGKRLARFTWQWEDDSPRVVIHETGHALGLPDYYDYDDEVGPPGGLGSMDIMSGVNGDHNGYSKWLLGWLVPQSVAVSGVTSLVLHAAASSPSSTVLLGSTGASSAGEYFVVQNRHPIGNDATMAGEGLLVFHVDARVGCDGEAPMYDNSFTEHKLIRLIEADGGDEIERLENNGEATDYFRGDGNATFGPFTSPSSDRYDGGTSGVLLSAVSAPGATMTAQAALLDLPAAPRPTMVSPEDRSDGAGTAPRIAWQGAGPGGAEIELRQGMNLLGRARTTTGATWYDVPAGWVPREGVYSVRVRGLGDGTTTGAGPFERSVFSTNICGPATWMERTFPTLTCGVQNHPGFAYEPSTGVTLQFGGGTSTAAYEYDGEGWTAYSLGTAPAPRAYAAMAADPAGGGVLMFGGLTYPSYAPLADTWRYDAATHTWQQLAPSLSPPASWTWNAVTDPARDVVLLVGYLGTWEWDGATWRDLGPVGTPALYYSAVAYDSRRQRVVAFGGNRASNGVYTNETWEFDGATWSLASPTVSPPARADHALVGHDRAGVVLLFGGRNSSTGVLTDLWAWDGTAWTFVPVCGGDAPGRWSDQAVFDVNRGVVVSGGPTSELATWELEVEGALPLRPARRGLSAR